MIAAEEHKKVRRVTLDHFMLAGLSIGAETACFFLLMQNPFLPYCAQPLATPKFTGAGIFYMRIR